MQLLSIVHIPLLQDCQLAGIYQRLHNCPYKYLHVWVALYKLLHVWVALQAISHCLDYLLFFRKRRGALNIWLCQLVASWLCLLRLPLKSLRDVSLHTADEIHLQLPAFAAVLFQTPHAKAVIEYIFVSPQHQQIDTGLMPGSPRPDALQALLRECLWPQLWEQPAQRVHLSPIVLICPPFQTTFRRVAINSQPRLVSKHEIMSL